MFRYFGTTTAKFGILTNGLSYKFYTDLEMRNRMDLKPFLEIDLLNIKESEAAELKKFHKSTFNIDELASSASILKYTNEIKALFAEQLRDPSDDYVRFFLAQIYDGVKTQAVVERFKSILKGALNGYITELMNEKIIAALKDDNDEPSSEKEDANEPAVDAPEIVTTMAEIEAYFIVKALIADVIGAERITYKDNKSCFTVLIDGNPRKWICRMYLDGKSMRIGLPDREKRENRIQIGGLNDLYTRKNELDCVDTRHVI